MATHSVLFPGKFYGWRSLVGYSPWGHRESDMTEQLHFLSFYGSFWRRKWQPTPVFLPRESHGWKGLVGYSLWGCKQSDMTKQLTHTHTHIGPPRPTSSLPAQVLFLHEAASPTFPSIYLFHPSWSVQGLLAWECVEGRGCVQLYTPRDPWVPGSAEGIKWRQPEDFLVNKKGSHEVMKWIQECWPARMLGKWDRWEMGSMVLALAKRGDVLAGRVTLGGWAAGIQDWRGGTGRKHLPWTVNVPTS